MKRTIAIASCLVVLGMTLIGAGGGFFFRSSAKREADMLAGVPKETVTKGRFTVTLDELGVLAAERSEVITPPFSGRVVKLIEDGTKVQKGDPIAWMDVEDEYNDIQDRITKLKTTKTELEQKAEDIRKSMETDYLDLEAAAAELEFDQIKLISVNRDLMNLETLHESELAAQSDLDKAVMKVASGKLDVNKSDLDYQSAFEERQSQMKTKDISMKALEHEGSKDLQRIGEKQENLERAVVTAPISGIFLLFRDWSWHMRTWKAVSVGDELNKREQIGSIPDLSTLIVQSQIPESAITLVKPGARCEITLDAFSGLKIPASVLRVGLVAIERERSSSGQISQTQEVTGQKVFEITVKPENVDDRLRPGMTANVSIVSEERDNALSLPLKAVFNKGGWKVVYLAKADGGYEVKKVTLGPRNRQRVIVLRGLEQGNTVFAVDLEPSPASSEGETSGPNMPAVPSFSGMGKFPMGGGGGSSGGGKGPGGSKGSGGSGKGGSGSR